MRALKHVLVGLLLAVVVTGCAGDDDRRTAALGEGNAGASLRWTGVYEKSQTYGAGDAVHHDGSAWVATGDVPVACNEGQEDCTAGAEPGGEARLWDVLASRGEPGHAGPQGDQGEQGPTGVPGSAAPTPVLKTMVVGWDNSWRGGNPAIDHSKCPGGWAVIGGGFYSRDGAPLIASYPLENGWKIRVVPGFGSTWTYASAFALCARFE